MKSYYRLMLGKRRMYPKECFAGNYVGVGYGITQDLSSRLLDDWRTFNREFIPVFLAAHPGKTKIAAGLACGALWDCV